MKNQSSKKCTCVKNRMIGFLFVGILTGLLAFWLVSSKNSFSQSERRMLATAPALSIEAILDGTFMEELQTYMTDTIPFRDGFRRISSWMNLHVFQLKDSEGVYIADGHAVKMEYPLKEDAIDYACDRFSYIYDTYLKGTDTKVYLSIIPDKNYFYAEDNGYLALDYDRLVSLVTEQNDYMAYIDIFSALSGEDYYRTDTHWRQECLPDVAEKLSAGMGNEIVTEYKRTDAQEDFYGVYYGQAALPLQPDKISYLTNPMIEQYTVFDYQNNKEIPVYDESRLSGKDPYELFVGGPISLATIENPGCDNGKHLVVFRDSFGSSLASLLAQGYSKTTLIDIRYILPAMLGNYVDFTDADVLFIYSTMVLNNSETLK